MTTEMLHDKPWAIERESALAVLAATRIKGQDLQPLDDTEPDTPPVQHVPVADGTQIAVIELRGTITPRGSIESLFGLGASLDVFRQQFQAAMADGNVSAIVLDIDSPGGTIDLVPETAAEILKVRGNGKSIVAVANTTCASAAYWIASAADQVVATPSAQVGSIGVFLVHEDVSRAQNAMGITTTLVSAGEAKTEGNPYEPLSKAARTDLQAKVDSIYGTFTSQVAQGRGVSQKTVQSGYGQGRALLANQAHAAGLVDRVETLEQVITRLGGQTDLPTAPSTRMLTGYQADLRAQDAAAVSASAWRAEVAAKPCPKCRAEAGTLCAGRDFCDVRIEGRKPKPVSSSKAQWRRSAPFREQGASIGTGAATEHDQARPKQRRGPLNRHAFISPARRLSIRRHRAQLRGDFLTTGSEPPKPGPRISYSPNAALSGLTLSIGPKAWDEICRLVQTADGAHEIGGALIGGVFDHTIRVARALPPASGAQATETSVTGDTDQDVIDEVIRKSPAGAREVGHWHSHPHGDGQPSAADVRALVDGHQLNGPDHVIELVITPHKTYGWAKPVANGWVLTRSDHNTFDVSIIDIEV